MVRYKEGRVYLQALNSNDGARPGCDLSPKGGRREVKAEHGHDLRSRMIGYS